LQENIVLSNGLPIKKLIPSTFKSINEDVGMIDESKNNSYSSKIQ